MQLTRVAETSHVVASTTKRSEKVAALAELFTDVEPSEIEIVVGLLVGAPRQGKIGIGWSTVSKLDLDPVEAPTLTLDDVDRMLTELARTTGPGSQARRLHLLESTLRRATSGELDFVRRVLVGEVRQGALAGVVRDGVAEGLGVPLRSLQRATMLSGDLGRAAVIAAEGGDEALRRVGLTVGSGVEPMLASGAESIGDAVGGMGDIVVEWKLDGARIQVHRSGPDVTVFTRNLNVVTDRLPAVVAATLDLPGETFVLDGEVMGMLSDGRPAAFQATMSTFGAHEPADEPPVESAARQRELLPFFFDLLHLDGRDLIDEPLRLRRQLLQTLIGDGLIPAVEIEQESLAAVDLAERHLEEAVAAGHEGVMIKALDSTYEAGRRGKTWRKVKPVHTLDLVVLAAEWGHGRRTGWLSNIHLGARSDEAGRFVMVGKTFKGMTDELLAWQTDALLEREVGRSSTGHTVHVRPELVVEIAVDGIQSSSRYPGGVALRFARVKGYRHDRDAGSADSIDAVRALGTFDSSSESG